MSLIINENQLELLLEKRKDQINKKKTDGLGTLVSSISFLGSSIAANYSDFFLIQGRWVKAAFIVLSITSLICTIVKISRSHKQVYLHTDLLDEIKKLNEPPHCHSIIAIKDTFNEFPNRFLLYYDQTWETWFFPNFQTQSTEQKNIRSIRNGISNQLKVNAEKIEVSYLDCAIHEKYSGRDRKFKQYEHKLYSVKVPSTTTMQHSEFEIEGIQYKWMTIAAMQADERIMAMNQDVVSFVGDVVR